VPPDVNSSPQLASRDNGLLNDAIHVVFVELSKLDEVLKKPIDEMTDLEKWAVFFRYANIPEYREVANKIIDSKEVLKVAGTLLTGISKDERERAIFRSRRMYQSDLDSNMAIVKREGEKAKAFAIAKNLLGMDMPIDQIVLATDLTREEVESLIAASDNPVIEKAYHT
jgi:predicted transposase/invertase (TIGR01784 family)